MRDATLDDIPRLIEWGREFHEATYWAGIADFVEADFAETCKRLIEHETGYLILNENGMAGAAMVPIWFNRACFLAQDIFVWGDGGLLADLEDLARADGASVFLMSAQHALRPEVMARWLRQKGYRLAENYYAKGL